MQRNAPKPTRNPIAIAVAISIAVVLIVWSGLDNDSPRLTPVERTATAASGAEAEAGITIRYRSGSALVPGGCFSVEATWGFNAVCDGDAADLDPDPGAVAMAFFGPDDPNASDPAALLTLFPPAGFVLTSEAAATIAFSRAAPSALEATVERRSATPIASPS